MQAIHEKIHGRWPGAGELHRLPHHRRAGGFADPADGLAFSLRFASWNRETGTLLGFSQLGGDRNLAQFRHSMSLVTTLHNFLYADRLGNIAYFGDGLVPVEPRGVDPRLPGAG